MRYLLIFHTVIDIWLLSHAVCTLNLPAHDIPKIIGFKIFYILEIKGDKVKLGEIMSRVLDYKFRGLSAVTGIKFEFQGRLGGDFIFLNKMTCCSRLN